MIKTIMKTAMVTVLIFVLQGCFTTAPSVSISIKQQDSKYNFTANRCSIDLPWRAIGAQSVSGKIATKRNFYSYGDEILILEKIDLDYDFMFSVGISSLAYAGFEFKSYSTTSLGDFYTYIEGIDKNGKNIYMIASGIGVAQDAAFLYSEQKETIHTLSSCIQGLDVVFEPLKLDNAETLSLKNYIKSDWGPKTLFKHDIIMSKRGNDAFMP